MHPLNPVQARSVAVNVLNALAMLHHEWRASASEILKDFGQFRRFEETFHCLRLLLNDAVTALGEEEDCEWHPPSISRGFYTFIQEGVLCGLKRVDPAAELFPDDLDQDELDLLQNTEAPSLDIDRDVVSTENRILDAYDRWLLQGFVLTGRIAFSYGYHHHDHLAVWWCSACNTWHSLRDPPKHIVEEPLIQKIVEALEADSACEDYKPFESYCKRLRTGY
jgi:hypothetical protein